jgi:hypothetical protein
MLLGCKPGMAGSPREALAIVRRLVAAGGPPWSTLLAHTHPVGVARLLPAAPRLRPRPHRPHTLAPSCTLLARVLGVEQRTPDLILDRPFPHPPRAGCDVGARCSCWASTALHQAASEGRSPTSGAVAGLLAAGADPSRPACWRPSRPLCASWRRRRRPRRGGGRVGGSLARASPERARAPTGPRGRSGTVGLGEHTQPVWRGQGS